MASTGNFPSFDNLRGELKRVQSEDNGGLGNHMWAVLVDRTGSVTAVAYSGTLVGDQWPGSRLIAAQKANTANGLSLDGMALSTANLYASTLPGGTLFGLGFTYAFNVPAAYAGPAEAYGTPHDPLVGKPIGGVITFGGGFALYDASGSIVGGLGVSGDLSCADHAIGWKLRHALELDYVPAGVRKVGTGSDDNIIYDFDETSKSSKSGWGHPSCSPGTKKVGDALPHTHPLRKR